MQLKKRITTSLALATCSLLGASPSPSIAMEGPKQWDFDATVLYYGEQNRVSDFSGSLLARMLFDRDRRLTATVTVDTLTGASATGAAPSDTVQTFTAPSGQSGYTIKAGQIPVDPKFHDRRFALAADWDQPLGLKSRFGAGFSFSREIDYTHLGSSLRLSRDFDAHNTTLSLGAAYSRDTVSPLGGTPSPFQPILPKGTVSLNGGRQTEAALSAGAGGGLAGSQPKTVSDILFSVTQVLGKRTIGQLSYSRTYSRGYLTDPYKVVSVIDPNTGATVLGPTGMNLTLAESRPDSRLEQSVFAEIRHAFKKDILDFSYRYMVDDWGIVSRTADLHYRWPRGHGYLEPRLRYYTQSAADFYAPALLDGAPLPTHVSADYRVGILDTYTVGFKYGVPQEDGKEWNIRIEYYNQSGKSPPSQAATALSRFNFDQAVQAVILQLGWKF